MFHGEQLIHWAHSVGYVGLIVIVFVECGFFFGFVLPGDSLLFAAGLLAAKGAFNIHVLFWALALTAILGYVFAYWFGKSMGDWLLKKPDSMLYKRVYLTKAQKFYARYGGASLVIGRIIPIVRTFVPIVAGMVRMNYRRFLICNCLGGLLWSGLFAYTGYYFGARFPHVVNYLLPIALGIITLSVLPAIISFLLKKIRR